MTEPTTTQGLTRTRSIAPRLVTGGKAALAAAHVLEAALAGLDDAAELVKDTAVEKAPLLTPENYKRAGRWGGGQGGAPNELKDSASVVPEHDARRVGVMFDAPYASYQHERLDWTHADGEAKFLEHAMTETRDAQLEKIAARIREVTER